MNGTIRLESTPGIGTQFLIDLPFRRAPNSSDWLAELTPPADGQLVFVSPKSANANVLSRYFQYLGWEPLPFLDTVAAQRARPSTPAGGSPFTLLPPLTSPLSPLGPTRAALRPPSCSEPSVSLPKPFALSPPAPWPVTPSALQRLLTAKPEQPPLDLNPVPSNALPVLVVVDNPINRKVASAMLARLGGIVDFAENGRIAVEERSLSRYHLILMDCPMPISLQSLRVLLTGGPPHSVPASSPPEVTP